MTHTLFLTLIGSSDPVGVLSSVGAAVVRGWSCG